MAKCQLCGKEVLLPFQCSFCEGYFCLEHRLPENHSCPQAPARTPLGHWKAEIRKLETEEVPLPLGRIGAEEIPSCPKCASERVQTTAYCREEIHYLCLDCSFKWKQSKLVPQQPLKRKRRMPIKKIIALLLILVILGVMLYNSSFILPIVQKMVGDLISPIYQPEPTYSHQELVNYALSLINKDRLDHGLSNVSLSSIKSGQEHAENMLEYHYLSHWDTNGYKPYMRYTLTGGRGAVAENCAWQYNSGSFNVKEAIADLERSMVYDDADSDWGHRDNILDPFHNRVSIGIAYDNHNVYYVQDFEDDYIEWSTFMDINSNSEVTLSGSFRVHQLSIESINIFYDAYPTNLTSDQLKASYSGSYSQGTFVGMALPPNYFSVEGITITAQKWMQTDNYFQIKFDLSQTLDAYGKGVYTLYIQSDSDSYHYLTSYSCWNN